jgi:hypothetical protein
LIGGPHGWGFSCNGEMISSCNAPRLWYAEGMPFICTLTEESCHAEVFSSGGEHSVVVRVGHEEAGDKTYSMVVGLSPQPPGEMEFFFFMAEADSAEETDREIWDSREISNLIGHEDRKKILAALLGAAQLLLSSVKPECFIVCTRDGNLPAPALEKYQKLNHLFSAMGYTVTATDPYHGKRSWWMELAP